jgi:hypothetical protein
MIVQLPPPGCEADHRQLFATGTTRATIDPGLQVPPLAIA